jgi:tetratricopeptide (TPR) repeat protein
VPADDFQLAVRHQALGHYEQALLHYMAALRANEFNVEARNNLGLLYHDRGLSTEAIDQFRRALLIDPRYVKARSNLAVVLMEAGRLAEARTELRAARAAEPASVDLLVNEALIEKADRQPDAAVEVLLQALRLQPRHAMANYNIAILYEERGSVPLAYDHYRTFLSAAAPEHAPLVPHVEERLAALGPRLTTGAAR